jgi:hypothetical protein
MTSFTATPQVKACSLPHDNHSYLRAQIRPPARDTHATPTSAARPQPLVMMVCACVRSSNTGAVVDCQPPVELGISGCTSPNYSCVLIGTFHKSCHHSTRHAQTRRFSLPGHNLHCRQPMCCWCLNLPVEHRNQWARLTLRNFLAWNGTHPGPAGAASRRWICRVLCSHLLPQLILHY